jgi:hypothetical protein
LNQFQHESTLLILGASEYQDWNLSGFVRFIVDWKMVITGYYNLISFQSSIESEPKVRLKKINKFISLNIKSCEVWIKQKKKSFTHSTVVKF